MIFHPVKGNVIYDVQRNLNIRKIRFQFENDLFSGHGVHKFSYMDIPGSLGP
jgi:hypothetical protein